MDKTITKNSDMQKQKNASCPVPVTTNRIKEVWLMVMLLCMVHLAVLAQTQTFTTTGTNSWVAPAGVTSITVEAWGAGGAGGGVTSGSVGAGGGGGGAYARTTSVIVTPGTSYTLTVGAGGNGGTGNGPAGGASSFNTSVVVAAGGAGGVANSGGAGGAGGSTAASTGAFEFAGGNGAAGAGGNSGGGGGGAGTANNGGNASGVTAGTGGATGGGAGGAGVTSSNDGNNGNTFGGGGSGGRRNLINRSGGDGANGRVIISWTCPSYSLTSTTLTTPLCVTNTATVTLNGNAANLPVGTYTVTYNQSAPNSASGVTKTMTVSTAGTGSFTTNALANAGSTTITITNLTSGATGGTCSTNISANNTAVVTVNALATTVAGTAITTCANAGAVNITAGSSASNNSGVQWTSSGTGTWTNGISLTLAEYTPSGADITAGSVTLTLTAFGNSPCGNVSSNKTLTIIQVPVVTPANICQGGSATLTATATCPNGSGTATGSNSSTFTLTDASPVRNITLPVSGVPAGATITDVNVSVTIAHNYQGDVLLSLAIPGGGTTVSLTGSAGAGTTNNLGNTTGTITETSTGAVVTYTFDQAAATQAWGSSNPATAGSFRPASGGGTMNTFNGLTTINGNWTLIADDDANGDNGLITGVTVTIQYTYPGVISWYTVPSGGNVVQTGSPFNPVGDAEVIAEGGVYANLANSNTSGTYTFYAACSSTPTCREAVNFVIDQAATANAGSNQSVCVSVGSATLNGSFGGNATSATWSSAGDGSFDNTSNMNAVYTFGAADISNGSVLLTLTTNDPAGVCDAVSSTMTITINTAPTITSNGNLSLNTSGSCFATVSNGQLLAQVSTTGSPAPSVTFSPVAGNFPVGTTTVTATAQNVCGTVQTTFDVIVADNENPVISNCPGNINLNNDAGLCSAVATWTAPTAADNCSIQSFTSTHNSGDVFPVGTTTVTYTATDVNGNTATCSFNVVVTDNTNPVISNCPANISINNDPGLCTAVATWTAPTAADNCGMQSFISSHNSGDVFSVGTTTVTYTATDVNGNIATCSFNVVVTDNTNPLISNCPTNISVNNDAGLCSTVATWTAPTAADNCAIQSFTSSHNSGDAFPVGTTTVTYTATDVNGNTATCSFNVVVADTEIPGVVNCPVDITVNNDPGLCSAVVNYTAPTVTDNCSGATISGSHNSGDAFPLGTTAVTYSALDASGNAAVACTFNVTVNSTAPSAPASVTTNAAFDNICNGNNVILTANGGSLGSMGGNYKWYTGSCGVTLVGTGASITQSPAVTTTYFARVEDNCGNVTSCASVTVTLSYAPDSANVILPFTGMPVNICTGTTANLSIAPVPGATYYVWDVPSGGYFNGNPLNVSPFTTATPNVQVTYGAPIASLYATGIQAGNACGNSVRKTQKVRGTTSVPSSVTGPLTSCANTSNTYSTTAVAGATSYLWSVTGDATVSGSGTSVTVNFGPSWHGGTLCVASQTTCYTSPTKCLNISKSAAALSAISGNFTACPNSSSTFSVNTVAGAATYNWISPANSTVTAGQGTNSATVSFGSGYNATGNICVSVTSICGVTSALKCKTVAPGLPSQPASIAGPTNGLCGQTVVYSCPSQGMGVTYTWTVPAGATISTGQGSTTISVEFDIFSTGSVCVKANSSCGSSATRCITVKGAPATPGAITATPSSWCPNSPGIEFNVNVAGLSGAYILSWSYPSSPIANYVSGAGNSTQVILDWGIGSGNVNVIATNVCGSGTKTSTWNSTCREAATLSESGFNVYPNPSSGIFNIDLIAHKGTATIQILDLTGRVVYKQNLNLSDGFMSVPVNISTLAKGPYLLHVNKNGTIRQVRIVIQ